MLIGETRRVFDTWKMDGFPYEKLLVKFKDYARNQRLDGEAPPGKVLGGLAELREPRQRRQDPARPP